MILYICTFTLSTVFRRRQQNKGALIRRTAELGMKSIAITDHGVMYGVVDFYKER